MNEIKVDLVVTWVNGQDPAWREQLKPYLPEKQFAEYQYRDWGWMRYWFRGVEKNLPWIRNIHFVTCGQIPEWLNTAHPKLRMTCHRDFIPAEYLPTFSANPIEMNLHRIEELSEHFIFSNDDMIFLLPMAQEDYFRNGLPCDSLRCCPITESRSKYFSHLLLNDLSCLNRNFDMRESARLNPEGWFNECYPPEIIEDNRAALRWNRFPGLRYDHMPIPLIKSGLKEIWDREPELMHEVSTHRTRDYYRDVNIFLSRFWNMASGHFYPYMRTPGKYCLISDTEENIRRTLTQGNRVVCLNEADREVDFENRKALILSLLEELFPKKSSYEK